MGNGIINHVNIFWYYRSHSDLLSKCNVGLKTLLQEDLLEHGFDGELTPQIQKEC